MFSRKSFRIISFFIFQLFLFKGNSQNVSFRTEQLDKKTSEFIYASKYDSAQSLVLEYLQQKDLSPLELFYGHFIYGNIIKSAGRPEIAIERFNDCRPLLAEIIDNKLYESLLNGKIAECYFDQMKYEEAIIYAQTSVDNSPDTSLRAGRHSVNYMIIGYGKFLEKKYNESLLNYEKATNEYINTGNTCELPLCYTKIALVHNAMGNIQKTREYIDGAILISDSCKIDQYVLLSKRAMFDIYKENREYEKALFQLIEINDLVGKMESEKQKLKVSELEIKYNTLLSEKENQNLKNINFKNEIILNEQNSRFYISLVAILCLIILLFFIIRLARQRKNAKENLEILNTQLEEKVKERTFHLSKATEKIRKDAELLERQNNQLTDFCNIVSHNLRSPLVNMSMLVDFIEKAKSEDEKRQMIEKLKPVINNLNETFNELVESLQVRQDKEIIFEKINIKESVKKILEGLEGEIIKSGAVIDTDLGDIPTINYPPKYFNSILHNLISNAIKYRSPQRTPFLKISTKVLNSGILLTVSDNGLGIDLVKYKDKIFKIRKVFHEHPDAKGFGLYITKTQIETMGDIIWVESKPNSGTTFFVEFKNQNV